MTTIPIYILAGQSNASREGVDAAIVEALSSSGGAYELVHFAKPGTQLAQYPGDDELDRSPLSEDELFNQLVQQVLSCVTDVIVRGFEPEISSIYWIQGEADGRSEDMANSYAANLEQFITALREAISAPDAPFVISMLSTQANSPFSDIIRSAQTQVAELENVVAVETSDLQFLDGLHYTLLSRLELGSRLVAAGEVLDHSTDGYDSETSSRTIIADATTIKLEGARDGDTLIGNALNNHITAGYGANFVEGGAGRDTVSGAFGNDTFFGGDGNDVLYGSRNYKPHFEAYAPGIEWDIDADVLSGEGGNDIINAGIGDDQLVGGTGDDKLRGEIGDDWLVGGDGSDELDGGLDADTMRGGAGNDRYWVDDLGDVVIEADETGTDIIYSSVDISLDVGGRARGDIENIALTGTARSATGNDLSNIIRGNAVDNAISGGFGDDALYGAAGKDTLKGSGGEDRLDGGAGIDALYGGAGSDLYYVDSSSDLVVERVASGVNDIVYAKADFALGAGQEIEGLRAAAGATGLRLTGNEFANLLASGYAEIENAAEHGHLPRLAKPFRQTELAAAIASAGAARFTSAGSNVIPFASHV